MSTARSITGWYGSLGADSEVMERSDIVALAIDPGYDEIGWAKFRGHKYVASGVVRFTEKQEVQRLMEIAQAIERLCTSDPEPGRAVVESPSHWIPRDSWHQLSPRRNRSLQKLNKAVGTIVTTLTKHVQPDELHQVRPQDWKGRRSKARVQWEMKAFTGKRRMSRDEADAVGLGLYFVQSVRLLKLSRK